MTDPDPRSALDPPAPRCLFEGCRFVFHPQAHKPHHNRPPLWCETADCHPWTTTPPDPAQPAGGLGAPRTAAGRALLEPFTQSKVTTFSVDFLRRAILAIEAEASRPRYRTDHDPDDAANIDPVDLSWCCRYHERANTTPPAGGLGADCGCRHPMTEHRWRLWCSRDHGSFCRSIEAEAARPAVSALAEALRLANDAFADIWTWDDGNGSLLNEFPEALVEHIDRAFTATQKALAAQPPEPVVDVGGHHPDCHHKNGDAVLWNPDNAVVQCHGCGCVYEPAAHPASGDREPVGAKVKALLRLGDTAGWWCDADCAGSPVKHSGWCRRQKREAASMFRALSGDREP